MTNFRSYRLKSQANQAKLQAIKEVFPEYRATASAIALDQWNYFFLYSRFNKFGNFREINTKLSARYLQTCRGQVVGQLQGFLTNLQSSIRKIIYKSSLSKEQKKILYTINKYKFWFSPSFTSKQGIFYSEENLLLSRKIFKQALKRSRKPRFKNIGMVLGSKVCEIHRKQNGKATVFDYWLRVSVLKRGKPVWIPLSTNSYFKSKQGKLKACVQINLKKDGNLKFRLTKDLNKESYEPSCKVIGLDLGFRDNFVFDSEGGAFGSRFIENLKNYTKRINFIRSNRNKSGELLNSPRLETLIRKSRSLIKNEINRIVNRVISIHTPKEIVIEDLDLRRIKSRKDYKRLYNNYGRRILIQKLESVQKLKGIKITKVNPAYTSQECNSCGYTDKKNRLGDKFRCLACGLKIHADTNGARAVRGRSSLPELNSDYLSLKKILGILTKRYLDQNSKRFLAYGRNPRPNSWAGVFERNPYFSQELKLLG
jgi:putative transposase